MPKKPELIYLTDNDAIDLFAPEQSEARPANDSPADSIEVFAPEPFGGSMRSAVALKSRSRIHPAALVALVGIAAISAVVILQRSNDQPSSLPVAPSEPSAFESAAAQPPLPPVTPPPVVADDPPPAVTTPAPQVEIPPPVAAPALPPRVPEQRAAASPPTATPRLPRPLSQDPARLAAGVSPPSPPAPRASVDVPAAPPPAAASASPPASTSASPPASSPASSPPVTAAPPPAATPGATPPATVANSPPDPTPTPVPRPTPSAAPTPSATTPAAASAAAAAAPAAASAVDRNASGIQNTLARYRKAFSALDVNAARDVWPTVNERTLNRAFERLEQQEVSFEGCQIDQIDAKQERAEAHCNGTARYVPRVGSRTPRVERRQWRFSLVKVRDEWLIGAVEAR
jgi:hypothetical protein